MTSPNPRPALTPQARLRAAQKAGSDAATVTFTLVPLLLGTVAGCWYGLTYTGSVGWLVFGMVTAFCYVLVLIAALVQHIVVIRRARREATGPL